MQFVQKNGGGVFSDGWLSDVRLSKYMDFRVQIYLLRYGTVSKDPGRLYSSSTSATYNKIGDNVRFDRMDHLSKYIPNNKRRKCARER